MWRPEPDYPGNNAEAMFARWIRAQGWTVTKRGWPDFMCRRGHERMAVEVKHHDKLSDEQWMTAADLTARGMPVFIWHPPARGNPEHGKLQPIFEVERIMSAKKISALEAAALLSADLQEAEEEIARLQASIEHRTQFGKRAQRAAAADRCARDAEFRTLMEDFGYLLRQAQDHQGGSAEYRVRYSDRLRKIIRRYPTLAKADRRREVTQLEEVRMMLEENPRLADRIRERWPEVGPRLIKATGFVEAA